MDFELPVKTDFTISDSKHLENSIVSDFISFNIYKGRINNQLDEVASKTEINGKTFYKKVNLKNKLSATDSPQRKLLNDFGFTEEVIQDIIDFNNDEDLEYLELNWLYKLAVTIEEFEAKIDELINDFPSTYKLEFIADLEGSPTFPVVVRVDEIEIAEERGLMLFALFLSNAINYTTKTEDPFITTLTEASVKETAKDLFEEYSGDAEVYEGTYIAPMHRGTGEEVINEYYFFWEGYQKEQLYKYESDGISMFYIDVFPMWSTPRLWLSKQDARIATKEEYLRSMSRYMTIDYEIDQSWFEKFISGLVNAFLGLIGSLLELIAKIPLIGDIFVFIIENIAKLFGIDSYEEAIVYLKQIILVIISVVIAYFTGQYQAIGMALSGDVLMSTYMLALVELYSLSSSMMSAINTAEMQWDAMENIKDKEKQEEEEANQDSPENMMADTNAPDREDDYMFESMFTVPDWGISMLEDQSDNEVETEFLNI